MRIPWEGMETVESESRATPPPQIRAGGTKCEPKRASVPEIDEGWRGPCSLPRVPAGLSNRFRGPPGPLVFLPSWVLDSFQQPGVWWAANPQAPCPFEILSVALRLPIRFCGASDCWVTAPHSSHVSGHDSAVLVPGAVPEVWLLS